MKVWFAVENEYGVTENARLYVRAEDVRFWRGSTEVWECDTETGRCVSIDLDTF